MDFALLKILFVSLFFPYKECGHAGGKHVYEIIRRLSKNHDIYLAARLENADAPRLRELRSFCREIYPYTYSNASKRGLFGNLKIIISYFSFSRFADRIIRKGGFDMVQVEWTEAAMMIRKRNTPMVLDAHDVITKPAERLFRTKNGPIKALLYVKYLLVKALELRTMKKFDMILTLSEFDKNYLLSMAPRLRVEVAPVAAGIDITERHFGKEQNTILFLASYKYRRVNVDAALYFYTNVFPLVRRSVPDAKFIIAGYGPPEELTSLPDKDPQVTVTGFVEDVDELYKKAAVFAAPILIGGGIIVKILDSMAAGTPVVTTTYGNEGIGAEHGRDLLVADGAESFASAVVKILQDPQLALSLSSSARGFVGRNFSVESVTENIESSYRDLVRHRAGN